MAQGGTTTQQGNGLAIAGLLVAVAANDGGFFSFQIG